MTEAQGGYVVYPWPKRDLATLAAACADAKASRSAKMCEKKDHVQYLARHLSELECSTILVEEEYVDGDFLDDFAAFYATAFQPYQRYCRRVHFFRNAFDQDAFDGYLEGRPGLTAADLSSPNYLGHMVLKPLTDAFVGRTCVQPYSTVGRKGEERVFRTVRTYTANVAGTRLDLDTLAFQEQDLAVSACATAALWSAFHMTSKQFQRQMPSPSEITRLAGPHTHDRVLPTRGLHMESMCYATKAIGLDVELRDDFNDLRDFVHAYSAGIGLPIVLGISWIDSAGRPRGQGHAVTVTGFALAQKARPPIDPQHPRRSRRIVKLYVHDDQRGPFSRFELTSTSRRSLIWRTMHPAGGGKKKRVRVNAAMVPIHPQIRIRYEDAWERMEGIKAAISPLHKGLEWDISVWTVDKLLKEIADTPGLPPALRRKILSKNFPKYIWRGSAYFEGKRILDVIMDATDLSTEFLVKDVLVYDKPLIDILKSFPDSLRAEQRRRLPHAAKWQALLDAAVGRSDVSPKQSAPRAEKSLARGSRKQRASTTRREPGLIPRSGPSKHESGGSAEEPRRRDAKRK